VDTRLTYLINMAYMMIKIRCPFNFSW